MNNETHWTERSAEDFLYSIASDFIEQLQSKMKVIGLSRSKLAKAAKVSKGRVSQIFKDPGNLSLETMIKFARALNMKVSVLAYEDVDDPKNERGPVNAEVFRLCWEHLKRPVDMWSFKQCEREASSTKTVLYYLPQGWHDWQPMGERVTVRPSGEVKSMPDYSTGFPKGSLSTSEEEASLSKLLSELRQQW